jgi:hypothetical protein
VYHLASRSREGFSALKMFSMSDCSRIADAKSCSNLRCSGST